MHTHGCLQKSTIRLKIPRNHANQVNKNRSPRVTISNQLTHQSNAQTLVIPRPPSDLNHTIEHIPSPSFSSLPAPPPPHPHSKLKPHNRSTPSPKTQWPGTHIHTNYSSWHIAPPPHPAPTYPTLPAPRQACPGMYGGHARWRPQDVLFGRHVNDIVPSLRFEREENIEYRKTTIL